jgi:hypothetical protein
MRPNKHSTVLNFFGETVTVYVTRIHLSEIYAFRLKIGGSGTFILSVFHYHESFHLDQKAECIMDIHEPFKATVHTSGIFRN